MSSGLDWERFGVITGGDEVCILPPPTLSEKGVGIPTYVYFLQKIVTGFLPPQACMCKPFVPSSSTISTYVGGQKYIFHHKILS